MDDIEYTEQKVFHVQLKNGHYFDFGNCSAVRDVRYEKNHLIITSNDRIRAVFDISEIAYAASMIMYFDWNTMKLLDKPPKKEP